MILCYTIWFSFCFVCVHVFVSEEMDVYCVVCFRVCAQACVCLRVWERGTKRGR